MKNTWIARLSVAAALLFLTLEVSRCAAASDMDLILYNGRIVTVDAGFSIQQAMAVRGSRIEAVGANEDILRRGTDRTQVLDLAGKMVLPGLIDSHVHACDASMTEFDHPIGQMDTIPDILDYVRGRAEVLDDGQWSVLQQVFIARLREQRYPTRQELDAAAPQNPTVFRTGPDASLNTLALKLGQIAQLPLRRAGPMLRIIGIKAFLDGGMLTGSAYMREPWGVSTIYGIDDPNYRGVLFIPRDRLWRVGSGADSQGQRG